jgi:mono/diheme cytochrome c family protein
MKHPPRLALLSGAAIWALTAFSVSRFAVSQMAPLPAHPSSAVTPADLLSKPIDPSAPNAAQLSRGQYLVRAGDCMSCHLRQHGEPLAGGLGLNTPFGVIYSSNITPDAQTGIGSWSSDQFYHAMHDGKGAFGEDLYPAFPYPWFSLASRPDDDAIFEYLKTIPAVHYTPPANKLPFYVFRSAVSAWNLLYFNSKFFQPDPAKSEEWNRGAYLVNGLGHCGACHTPKSTLGGDKASQQFYGGDLDNWVAPDLTSNARTGLGAWSAEDIAEYLKTGRNARAGAGGPMAEVITYSTSLMTDADRHAIAVYLKDGEASPDKPASAAAADILSRGAAIYSDACSSCHFENGVGQPQFFPPLGHNAMLQQQNPMGLEHLILAGGRIGTSPSRPSPLSMPSFAWKLTDQQIADVSTYIRSSWGNQAGPVSADDVRNARRKVDLDTVHLTDNSGDHP